MGTFGCDGVCECGRDGGCNGVCERDGVCNGVCECLRDGVCECGRDGVWECGSDGVCVGRCDDVSGGICCSALIRASCEDRVVPLLPVGFLEAPVRG